MHGQLAQHLRSLYPKGDPPTPRGTWGNLGETRGGVGKKWHDAEQKRHISETRKDRGKVTRPMYSLTLTAARNRLWVVAPSMLTGHQQEPMRQLQ